MATLHIEHSISDLETWLGAFSRFEEARREAGVRAQRIAQPVDDDKYIYVALDFDSVEAAKAFKGFLETKVWASAEASPALEGKPRARILLEVSMTSSSRSTSTGPRRCPKRSTPGTSPRAT